MPRMRSPVFSVTAIQSDNRQCIKGTAEEQYLSEAFIPFHEPKAHADRQDCLPHEKPDATPKWERRLCDPDSDPD
jgi:hypothetical protein